MIMSRNTLHAALLSLALPALAAAGAAQRPDYTAYCSSPVALSPEQATGSPNSARFTAMAWNGQEYGVLYHDRVNSRFSFRRIYADGTPAAAPVIIAASGAAYGFNPSIVWNGSDYAIAWTSYNGTYFVPYFGRISAAGVMLSGPTQLSFVGATPSANADNPQIAWSGSGYAVVWEDNRNTATTGYDIYYTMLDATGAVAGALHDINLYPGLNLDDYSPRIAWSSGAGRYMAVWTHTFTAFTSYQVYGAGITPAGAAVALGNPIAGSGFNALNPDIAGNSSGFAAAWSDARDAGGGGEIYAARFSGWGVKLGADTRLTSNTAADDIPRISWTGSEFGVFYPSTATGNINDIWMARLSAAGAAAGSPVQLTFAGDAYYGNAAFGLRGYLLTYSAYQSSNVTGQNFSLPVGCYGGSYAPGCPEQPVAYSITGTSATLAWLPAYDYYTDIAYYDVYRNGSRVGRSSDTFYNDTGLSLSGTYQYSFRTVNAGQYFSTGCSNTIYVKTNSSLTLTMNKASLDAKLDWTSAGFSSYNIFRGTSPQVMSQIGATPALTANDANALADSASYFYTVDDPGQ